MTHPRDRFITVYGRQAVLEALEDATLPVDKVILATNARGAHAAAIVEAAGRRSIPVERRSPDAVTRISRNGRHDQGVVADVEAPAMGPLEGTELDGPALLLDGITNPQNVGMIIRTATAAGLAVVLPRSGVPDIGPLVIKASAGVAFKARILRCESAVAAAAVLAGAGHHLVGVAAEAGRALFEGPAEMPGRTTLVLGSESAGISAEVASHIHEWVAIPMAGGVDSLNVAVAAGVVCFDLVRRRATAP